MVFDDSAEYRKVILINSILFFGAFIFFFFAVYNVILGRNLIALFDLVAGVVISGAIIDLRINKNVTRAGDIGILSLFVFFIVFVYVNQNTNFGLIWTIFFPIFAMMIRQKSALPFIAVFYGIIFTMAYINIGVWQDGIWDSIGFTRLVVASVLLTYVIYISERSRHVADRRNDDLLQEQKKYQQELEIKVRKTLAELGEKEKIILRNSQLAEMGNLIGVIANQFKQPLTAISLINSDMKEAQEHKELDETYLSRAVEDIDRQISYLSETLNNLKDFFNPNRERSYFKTADAVQKTLDLLRPQLERSGIEIVLDMEWDLSVYGLENELQQVLINIIRNAQDAIMERKVSAPSIRIVSYREQEKEVVLRIEDNGGGMPEPILSKIFDPYFTTRRGERTGLGLYVVRKILQESFNGQVSAYNLPGGCAIVIRLPQPRIVG